jgi:glutaredoxin
VDSVPCLQAWADSLGGISYPLLSDFYPHGQVAQRYGVLRPDGTSERAIFVIEKSGIIRYVDVHAIDEQPDNEVLFRILAEIEPELAARQPRRQAAWVQEAEAAPQADVVLYCTSWCPDCKRARLFLEKHDIPYVEINISKDRAAAQRLRDWTGGKEITPTFDIRGKILVEYSEQRLAEALGIER